MSAPYKIIEESPKSEFILGRPMSEAEHEMFCDFEGTGEEFREYMHNLYNRATLIAYRASGCTCSEAQINAVGCDCHVDHANDPYRIIF